MKAAALVTWLGRFLFLALLYFFVFQLYRALLGAHTVRTHNRGTRSVPIQGGRDRSVSAFGQLGRVVLVAAEPSAGVWLEERDGKERRLAQSGVALIGEELTIGRGAQNRLRIGDPHISNRHCVIRPEKDGYVLEDLGTTNGTYVNGAQVRGVTRLDTNSAINVGSVQFRFEVT